VPIGDEAFYRELVEGMNDGVLAADGSGTITFASARLCAMLGRTTPELVGTRVERLLPAPRQAPWTSPTSHSGAQTFEVELAREDGGPIVVLVSRRPVFDAHTRLQGTIALVTDITVRRRESIRLQEVAQASAALTGQEFFRSIMRSLAAAFELQAVFVAECADYPTTRVRILAEWDRGRFTDSRDFQLAGTPCKDTVQNGRVCSIPDNLLTHFPDYASRDRTSYLGVPLFDTNGRIVIGHLAFWDSKPLKSEEIFAHPIFQIFASRIGAELRRKRAEEQAQLHLQQLAHVARLSSMGEMATVIAHEINQPLTAIVSYSQACVRLLRSGAAPIGEVVAAMERVATEADRASQIIRHLRSLVRKEETQVAPVELDRLIEEVVRFVQPEARRASVEIKTELAGDLPLAMADNIQIQQVLMNLVRNAIEAASGARDQHEVRIVTRRTGDDTVETAVIDTGSGFDDEMAAKLFEPFFTTKAHGMGIGLAISRSIIEAHHGRIWTTATPGQGARFYFTLPAYRP
jgi:PAS domain S-box-containing protein